MDAKKLSQIAMGGVLICLALFAFNIFRSTSEQAAYNETMNELSTDIERLRENVEQLAERLEQRGGGSSPADEGNIGQRENDWCRRISSNQVRLRAAAWVLRTAESNGSEPDSLVCGEQGLADATGLLDLVRESAPSGETPPVIGTIPEFCEFPHGGSNRVRVYHEMGPVTADVTTREALWGVAVLAAASIDAQSARVDGLIRRIRSEGCDAVAQELGSRP